MRQVVSIGAMVVTLGVGCQTNMAELTWGSNAPDTTGSHSPPITVGAGSQMVSGGVARTGSQTATATLAWTPGAHTGEGRFEVRLFPADGGTSILVGTAAVRSAEAEHASIEVQIEDEALEQNTAHWVMVRFYDSAGGALAVSSFPGNWMSLGVLLPPTQSVNEVSESARGTLKLAFGGDANLGRRQNGLSATRGPADALSRLTAFKNADLSLLNLECVIASGGEVGVEKGEAVPFYYRGRPEQAQVLTEAGVDVVATANNHAGDYGASALIEQREILSRAGVLVAGSGPTIAEACEPVFVERGGVTVAVVSADTTLSLFGAEVETPGTCHVSGTETAAALSVLGPAIERAREQADVVFVAMHWGKNLKSRPSTATRRLARAIINAGADAILGSSAHKLQGVEIVDGRPVIYDAGNVLFDSHAEGEMARSGFFVLDFDQDGVHGIEMHPIDVDYGFSRPAAGNSAARTMTRFRDLSAELGTHARIESGVVSIQLPDPPVRVAAEGRSLPDDPNVVRIEPASAPPSGCVVDSVPDDAKIEPRSWGPIQLIGARMVPSTPTERNTVWVETWWKTDAVVPDDLWIYQRVKSKPHQPGAMWWADHEHCDWAWPTSRWRPGDIHRDVYGVRPPKRAEPGAYELVIGLIRGESRMAPTQRIFEFQYR